MSDPNKGGLKIILTNILRLKIYLFYEDMWDPHISLLLFVLMRGKGDFSPLNYIAHKYHWPMLDVFTRPLLFVTQIDTCLIVC